MTPQENLAREERPLPSLEVRPPLPAPSPPRPLREPDTDPEVQNPSVGGAPYGDTREETIVTNRLETPPVRHNSPRVSTPSPAVTIPPRPCTRQPPAYRKDLVRGRAISDSYKYPIGHRTGDWAKKRGSCEHHENINFCSGRITNEIHPPETKSPSHVSQPCCPVFSYADAVKSRRAKKQLSLPLSFKMSYYSGSRGKLVMFLVRKLDYISQL